MGSTSVMGDLGLTFLAAAISCSWLTSSLIDNRSSGLIFNIDPRTNTQGFSRNCIQEQNDSMNLERIWEEGM